jgi:hypothetical protein
MGSYQGRPQARQHPDRAVGSPLSPWPLRASFPLANARPR